MQDCFKKVFHLQGVVVTKVELEGNVLVIHCRLRTQATRCRTCGQPTRNIQQRLKPQRIKHMFWEGNLVVLSLTKRMFSCRQCWKAGRRWLTVESVPWIPRYRRYSLVYAAQVLKALGNTAFKTMQEVAGTSFSTIRRILYEGVDPFVGVWPENEVVRSLGLDCHSFSGQQMLPTVTDLTNHRLISILPDDRQTTVQHFLHTLPESKKRQIEEVCIDMDTTFLKPIREELPQARIVVDFFHVVADANRRITAARLLIQQTEKVKLPQRVWEKGKEHLCPNEWAQLNEFRTRYPELGQLWYYKERLRLVYRTPSGSLAKILFGALLKEMALSSYPSVRHWVKTLKRWQEPILQYFAYHTTNGYTEGVNTKLKTIKRLSYGFRNVDNYIRKALLSFVILSLLTSHYLT